MHASIKPPEAFLAALRHGWRRLLRPGAQVLLAVSGGADSTALLRGAAALGKELDAHLEVASIDHGLRPEAEREVASVRALAATLGIPFHTARLSIAEGAGLEARARQARYEALDEIRGSAGLEWVATAHTVEDQAETVLMRLSRGAGLAGAASIHPLRNRLVRPMLEVDRGQVRAFLESLDASFSRDPMNADPTFLRVRIREEVLPALTRAAGPSAPRALARFAQLAGEDEAYLDGLARSALARLRWADGGVDRAGFLALAPPIRRRVARALLQERQVPVEAARVERLLEGVLLEKRRSLGDEWALSVRGGRVRLVYERDPRRHR